MANGTTYVWNGLYFAGVSGTPSMSGMTTGTLQSIPASAWSALGCGPIQFVFDMANTDSGNASVSGITVTMAPPNIWYMSGPATLETGQNGNFSSILSYCSGTMVYQWSGDDGSHISGGGSGPFGSASGYFDTAGEHTVTVTVSVGEVPGLNASRSVQVNVVSPPTGTVNCPSSLETGVHGTCTAALTTSYGTLNYAWSGPPGSHITPSADGASKGPFRKLRAVIRKSPDGSRAAYV